jgi:hydroxymethylpyrimidine pyrophosphatase-like HAD family hydrolase
MRLAVVDIDGCLTPGEGKPWDLAALGRVRAYNEGERPLLPVTVCTGRQAPYLEAFMQAIGAMVPGVFEHGAGLYDPVAYRAYAHPAFTAAHVRARAEVLRLARQHLVAPGLGSLLLGKEFIVTLYRSPTVPLQELWERCSQLLAGIDEFEVIQSASCVDVLPRGIDKGAGVAWLSERMGVPLAEMGGIGDSNCDWAFLRLTGASAAPANAQDDLRGLVQYVSPHEQVYGTLDILGRWAGATGGEPMGEG